MVATGQPGQQSAQSAGSGECAGSGNTPLLTALFLFSGATT